MHVVEWRDSSLAEAGVDPRSCYVEMFWLPALGPSTTWLLRRLADRLDAEPDGFDLALDETARGLGLGWSDSRHAPLRRAIERCVRYGLARRDSPRLLSVRRRLPPVPRRHLLRLPVALQEQHRAWESAELDPGEAVRLRRRARLVALDLRDLGVDDACIERHLLRRGVHPATAFEAARWVWSPESELDRPLRAGHP
jgi:GNAT superfamily N-acetyltransferase